MKSEEFVKKLKVRDKIVKVGLDDYGQCYFFEYIDDNGKTQEVCCSSYNPYYKDEIAGYFGVDVSDIKEIYSIMSDEELSSTKQEVEELRKEIRQLESKISELETDIAVENMMRNQELIGKCFVNGNKYYKAIGSFGADKYNVYCLCLDFGKEICNYYRVPHMINGISRYCTLSANHLIKVELVAKGNLGKEIESYTFEEKIHEIADKILIESDNLNKKLYDLYKEDIERIGEEDLEKRKAIKRALSEDHLC